MSRHIVYLTDYEDTTAPPSRPVLEVGYCSAGNGQPALIFLDIVACDEDSNRTEYTTLKVSFEGRETKAGLSVDAVALLQALATVMDDHTIWTALVRERSR